MYDKSKVIRAIGRYRREHDDAGPTVEDICDLTRCSVEVVLDALDQLVSEGQVRTLGSWQQRHVRVM